MNVITATRGGVCFIYGKHNLTIATITLNIVFVWGVFFFFFLILRRSLCSITSSGCLWMISPTGQDRSRAARSQDLSNSPRLLYLQFQNPDWRRKRPEFDPRSIPQKKRAHNKRTSLRQSRWLILFLVYLFNTIHLWLLQHKHGLFFATGVYLKMYPIALLWTWKKCLPVLTVCTVEFKLQYRVLFIRVDLFLKIPGFVFCFFVCFSVDVVERWNAAYCHYLYCSVCF